MSSNWSHGDATTIGGSSQDFDHAEKGLYEDMQRLPVLPPAALLPEKQAIPLRPLLSPVTPVHEGITPTASMPMLSMPTPTLSTTPAITANNPPAPASAPKKPAPQRRKVSRWIKFQLWFNTYRKFFTFVTLLNLVGIIMAALDRFHYAEKHLGAMVLGNLLCAILMRNELFLRFLYVIAIYGLRWVRGNY